MLQLLWDGHCYFNKEWCGFQWKHEAQTIWLIPSKAVKSKFIVPVYISMHVPEKSGNYKPRAYFSPLWVCINVQKNAASVLHLPHCSDCTLWTLKGGFSASLHFSTHLASAVIPHTHIRHILLQNNHFRFNSTVPPPAAWLTHVKLL